MRWSWRRLGAEGIALRCLVRRSVPRISKPSFPRRRAPLYFGVAEHPEPSAPSLQVVIPANAGIQRLQRHPQERHSREGGLRFTSA
ncbi:hypothetical protein [Lysobacter gummosus]|uniref:hypothetical protein n=1 Tax=Lysobacter gummosus TaxID=262324 RepID=UPI00362DC1C6